MASASPSKSSRPAQAAEAAGRRSASGGAATAGPTPAVALVLAVLVLLMLLPALRVREALSLAEAQGAALLGSIEPALPPSPTAPPPPLPQATPAFVAAVTPMAATLAVAHCEGTACRPLFARPGAQACDGSAMPAGSAATTRCVSVASVLYSDQRLTLSYDLRPALITGAIDAGLAIAVLCLVLWVWQRHAAQEEEAQAMPTIVRSAKAPPLKGTTMEHDPLTGLLNRVAFESALKRHNEDTAASGERTDGCLMYFDLDRFKLINDTHGHNAGDQVLQTVAQRLRFTLGQGVLIGRLGGDEFAALLSDVSSKANVETICRVLIEQVSKPIDLGEVQDWVGLSIGAFMLRRGALDIDEMLHRADLAMYEAKRAGRGRVVFFDASMDEAARSRARIQNEILRAIEGRQFFMVYQPQFDVNDQIRGVESMVRWRHPQRGLIPPQEFMPIAEQSGLIVPLGKQIIDMVCTDLVRLRAQKLGLPYVSIDVSMRQLSDSGMVEDLQAILQRHGLSPDDLEFEVTESAAMVGQVGKETATLKKLSALAFRIAIDDFGTGYSSMGRLLDLKVDKLKIDHVFVDAIGQPGFNPALLELMIGLADRLGVKSVAEGVSSLEQVVWLRRAGCRMMQGDFFAKPMDREQLANWLKMQAGDADADRDNGRMWQATQALEEGKLVRA